MGTWVTNSTGFGRRICAAGTVGGATNKINNAAHWANDVQNQDRLIGISRPFEPRRAAPAPLPLVILTEIVSTCCATAMSSDLPDGPGSLPRPGLSRSRAATNRNP